MNDSAVARCIRARSGAIAKAWQRAVADERPELEHDAAELARYLPEFLDKLADSAAEATKSGRGNTEFSEVAQQHALAGISAGTSLEALSLEYALLRRVVLEQLRTLEPETGEEDCLARLHEALDHATELAVRCYGEQRSSQGDRFVRLLGHDLRNPLNAAFIATDALTRSESLTARGQKRLTTITRANARMGRLIDNMLEFARSHFGGDMPLLLEEGDWGEVCAAAFEELRSENPERQLRFSTAANLVGAFDRQRLRQVVLNLLGNALEHGQDPIELSIGEEERDGERRIVTRVSSRGDAVPHVPLEGLDPLAEPKIASGSNSRLGLFVTSLIAKAHGAACEVTSDAEESSFSIRWPRTVVP